MKARIPGANMIPFLWFIILLYVLYSYDCIHLWFIKIETMNS